MVLFVLAVVTIILTIYLVLAAAMVYAAPNLPTARLAELSELSRTADGSPIATEHLAPTLWQPETFLWVAVGTVLVISLGSLYKISPSYPPAASRSP